MQPAGGRHQARAEPREPEPEVVYQFMGKVGIVNVVGNLGTVFVDQSCWQCAVAAEPVSADKGYLLGGLVVLTSPSRSPRRWASLAWRCSCTSLPTSLEAV